MKDGRDCARVVLPSQWAKVDVRSRIFHEEVYVSSTGAHESPYCIEKAPVVQNREVYLQRQLHRTT